MEKKNFNISIFFTIIFFFIINYNLYSQEKTIKYECYNKKCQTSNMFIIFNEDTIMLSFIKNNIFNNDILGNSITEFNENDTFDILIKENKKLRLIESLPLHILKCGEVEISIEKVKNTKKVKHCDTFITYCGSHGISLFHKVLK